ncbi:MAG: hypothetical protein MUE63_06420 [Xanthomonadales bacterium]|jgi:hypothetical protein|nr:hypothetical protein [Xanthomonadales bacterium]
MADRYLILGATYNGDGTSASEAASNGDAGAWNQQSIITGTAPTYGTLSADDVVYIRSKTGGGANANITIALSAATTIGSANGTAASPVKWVIDQGEKWSGVVGSLWFTASAASYSLTFRAHNHWRCADKDNFGYRLTTSAATDGHVYLADNVSLIGFTREATGTLTTYMGMIESVSAGQRAYLENVKYKGPGTSLNAGAFNTKLEGFVTLVNCEVELTDVNNVGFVFRGAGNARFLVLGGRAYGNGLKPGLAICANAYNSASATIYDLIGFQIPESVPLNPTAPTASGHAATTRGIGLDDNFGAYVTERWGYADSRNDGNYPKLNAALPNSAASLWSWFIYPSAADPAAPAVMRVLKSYTDTAAQKKITLELLIANGYNSELNKDNACLIVKYISNTTGLPVYQSTRVHGSTAALDAGSSSWTATAYGSTACTAKKLELTTTDSIKKDTPVVALLLITKNASIATKFLFMCPDVQLSTP